jgi:hypothetical protein
MTQRVLPAQLARTMLSAVTGSSHFSSPSKLTRRGLCSLLSLGVLGAPAAALAQADSGWFDAPPEGGVPDPYYAAPEAEPAPQPEPEVPDNDPSALTTFRPTLDPYGYWVNDATYGTVWVPHAHVVGSDFAPYVSRGRWALTADDDWIWVSDYPFGWAVFHYGRWVWISGYGWSWVPGRTYANAWVVWRVPTADYAYVGWAPMPPSWAWHGGVAVGLWYAPPVPYVFCHTSFIFYPHVHHHIVHDRHLVHRIASRTRVYPTTYHAPARPTVRPTASSPRPAPPPASAAPRGPRLSSARVPPSAVPRERAAPPANAARLSGMRRMTSPQSVQRAPAPDVRSGKAAPRLPAESRGPVTSEPVRRSTPSSSSPPASSSSNRSPSASDRMRSSPDRARSSAPRVRSMEPRSVAPVRSRPPVRDASPAPAPVRSRRRP